MMSKGLAQEYVITITVGIIIVLVALFLYYFSMPKTPPCTVGTQCIIQGEIGYYNTQCQCVPKPECQIDKYFTCSDGSKVIWCLCQDGKYNCLAKPENQCQGSYCNWAVPETWGTCLSNFGCGIGCSLVPTFAQQHGCDCSPKPPELAKEGESCVLKACEAGLECQWDTNPLNGFRTCKVPSQPSQYADYGESCLTKQCMAGLYCVTTLDPLKGFRECQFPAKAGESCLTKPCEYPLTCKFDITKILQGFKVCG